jgi:hypothetical protein
MKMIKDKISSDVMMPVRVVIFLFIRIQLIIVHDSDYFAGQLLIEIR